MKADKNKKHVGKNAATWLGRAVLAYRHIQTAEEKRGWFYMERNGKQQGPFSAAKMRSWFQRGCFSAKTMVRYSEIGAFAQIQELFPDARDVFPSEAEFQGDMEMALASIVAEIGPEVPGL